MQQNVTITAADGFELGGTFFPAPDSQTVAIIHGATAVPHGFYRRFAQYLQTQGWSVLTYDYRGGGASRPASLRGFDARASDWGLLDMPATLAWARQTLRAKKIYFIGHSAGGQQAGLLADPGPVAAMLTVSSQSGYWRYQVGAEKFKVLILTSIVLPLLAHTFGYLPWSKLRAGEDLPKGAALQWARWCRDRDYLLGDESLPLERYKSFAAPVLAYSIADDDWGSARSVDAMMSAYPNVERRHIVPVEYGLAKVGHMGYFRDGSQALWQEGMAWLAQH